MGSHLLGLTQWLGQQNSNWLQLVLATPVVLWAGFPFFERALASLKNRSLNMFTLIAMGTGVAWMFRSGKSSTSPPERFDAPCLVRRDESRRRRRPRSRGPKKPTRSGFEGTARTPFSATLAELRVQGNVRLEQF